MQTLIKVKQILSEILDVDEDQITDETYLIRELDAESIDLLEVALELGSAFEIDIRDDDIFLRNLRILIEEADTKGQDPLEYLMEKMAHINKQRLMEMLEDLPGGPVLKVGDLVQYIEYVTGKSHVA
ncbi:MAG: phosphopantetheine-binding protein [Pseudomonadota bacterium]